MTIIVTILFSSMYQYSTNLKAPGQIYRPAKPLLLRLIASQIPPKKQLEQSDEELANQKAKPQDHTCLDRKSLLGLLDAQQTLQPCTPSKPLPM